MDIISGSCLRGDVTHDITAAPLGFVPCHCARCRKTTGSSFAANLIVAAGPRCTPIRA